MTSLGARTSDAVRAALKGFEPSPEQWDAIAHPLEPIHLIAAAGSGKTAVMAARMVWAIESQGFSPGQILGLTFTNKATEELAERVRQALEFVPGDGADEMTVQTYNAFAAGIVRDHGLLVGIEPDAGLLSDAQQWQLVLSCLDDLPPLEAIELRSAGGIVTATLALASSISNHKVDVDDVEKACDRLIEAPAISEDIKQTALRRKELCAAVRAYEDVKRRRQRIDFGDQVTKAVDILTNFSDVRESYRQRFPIVLLDEYQDTNVSQRLLIEQLVSPGGSVTAVGDARQAIYAWRGATMFNLIGFPRHFPRTSGPYEPISLSENFRSGRRILETANAVVERIDPKRRPGAPLRAHSANGEGHVSLHLFSDERAEAVWIAQECERLHETVMAEGRDPVRWRDMAVLVRRKAAMDALLMAFEELDVPVEVVGLGGLLKTPEVVEIVAWLRSLETKPSANRWLARVLLGPRWRIDYRDLALCARWAADQNWDLKVRLAGGDEARARDMEPGDVGFALAEALAHVDEIEGLGPEAQRRLRSFASRLSELRKKTNLPLLELVQEVIRCAGIGDALDSSPSRAAPAARQNVANLLDQVSSFAPVEGEASLRSFLAYLDAAEAAEETLEAAQPADQDSVKLMTVHAAKGLEFECVFVPSVAAGKGKHGQPVYSIFPNTKSSNPLTNYKELPYEVREDASDLPRWKPGDKTSEFEAAVRDRVMEDERRLFYVALTRAKQRLAVSAAWWYGRDAKAKGPSLFWEELEELAETDLVELARRDEDPGGNPMFDVLEARRSWPPTPRTGIDDPLFPEGWGAAADAFVSGAVGIESFLERLGEDADAATALQAEFDAELDLIAAAHVPEPTTGTEVPDILAATAYVGWKAGAIQPFELIRPLPGRPTEARRLGTEVHRLIEESARGISPYADESELDEPGVAVADDVVRQLIDKFEASGYGARNIARLPSGEPMIELPFALKRDGKIIRGRIDAVYETADGLEIVDYKTGARFEPTDDDQLSIYAEALRANGLVPEGATVTLTYLFLSDGDVSSRTWAG